MLRAVSGFFRESGRFDEAISSLKEVSDKSAEYWGEFGYTYQLAGRKNEAAEAYVHAANQDRNEINYQLSAALALLNAGKLNEAKTFIQRGDGISPNHYRLHAIRGQLASVENRSDDAITEYQAAIANLPAEGVQEGVLYPVELHINLAEQYRSAENQNAATD